MQVCLHELCIALLAGQKGHICESLCIQNKRNAVIDYSAQHPSAGTALPPSLLPRQSLHRKGQPLCLCISFVDYLVQKAQCKRYG